MFRETTEKSITWGPHPSVTLSTADNPLGSRPVLPRTGRTWSPEMSWSPTPSHPQPGSNIIELRVPPRLAASDALRLACKVVADPRAVAAAQATHVVVPSMRLTA